MLSQCFEQRSTVFVARYIVWHFVWNHATSNLGATSSLQSCNSWKAHDSRVRLSLCVVLYANMKVICKPMDSKCHVCTWPQFSHTSLANVTCILTSFCHLEFNQEKSPFETKRLSLWKPLTEMFFITKGGNNLNLWMQNFSIPAGLWTWLLFGCWALVKWPTPFSKHDEFNRLQLPVGQN